MKYNYTDRSKYHSEAGLTLIELLLVTVILSIIAATAIPMMRGMFTEQSVKNIVPLFERSIKLARVEASERSVDVRVLPTSGTGDWSQGWFIEFTDENGIDQLIRRFDALPSNPIFSSPNFNGAIDLVIRPTGQARSVGSFDLYYPGCSGNERYTLQLLLSGFIQKTVNACPP